MTSTRPLASVNHLPAWLIGSTGADTAWAAAMPGSASVQAEATITIRTSRAIDRGRCDRRSEAHGSNVTLLRLLTLLRQKSRPGTRAILLRHHAQRRRHLVALAA